MAKGHPPAAMKETEMPTVHAHAPVHPERESFYRPLRKHGVRPDGGLEEPDE
jgi:hypothetical protein